MTPRSAKRLEALRAAYESSDDAAVLAYQLSRVNALWAQAGRRIPHYAALKMQHELPDAFESLEEYVQLLPPLEKADLQRPDAPCSFPERPPDRFRATGGSTAAPLQIPAWTVEFRETRGDPWLGRSWFGVQPRDRLFLYWGHSHLLGTGWRGAVNGLLRFAKDTALGYVRYSAYDLSEPAIRKAAEALLIARPAYMIGYSYALDRFARVNADRVEALRGLRLKTVIATGESLPFDDSREVIEDAFGAPLGLEYGAVETGVLAHSAPGDGLRTLWRSHLLETVPGAGGEELFVTTLTPRCTPLFRYRIGDALPADGLRRAGSVSVTGFRAVAGRSNMPVRLPSGRSLHSEAVSHLVRDWPSIAGYQFVCDAAGVRLEVLMREALSDDLRQRILDRATIIDEELGRVLVVEAVQELRRSIAGKTPMVVYQ